MRWCSGTELFDDVYVIIEDFTAGRLTWDRTMEVLVLAFQRHDWDCESDSEYWETIVRPAMKRLRQLGYDQD